MLKYIWMEQNQGWKVNQDDSAEEKGTQQLYPLIWQWYKHHRELSIYTPWSDNSAFLHRFLWNIPWLKVESGKKLNQTENPTEELYWILSWNLFLECWTQQNINFWYGPRAESIAQGKLANLPVRECEHLCMAAPEPRETGYLFQVSVVSPTIC